MNFKPILFSTPMIQAILEGRKTQTRREIKPQPVLLNDNRHFNFKKDYYLTKNDLLTKCKIKKGDVLWLRESFRYAHHYGIDYEFVQYKDMSTNTHCQIPDKDQILHDDKWKPSIHMPKLACRIFLEVTNVRLERLQDISNDDAIAEGIENFLPEGIGSNAYQNYTVTKKELQNDHWAHVADSPIHSFETLWESINGKKSWNENPWVWVYDFKRIEKPENFI